MRDDVLAIISRRQRGERELRDRQPAIEQDEHPEDLANLVRRYMFALNEPARESIAVEHVEKDKDDPRHREQAIITRVEDANHQEGRSPLDDLRDDLTA